MTDELWKIHPLKRLKRPVKDAEKSMETAALLFEEVRDGKTPVLSYTEWTDVAEDLWNAKRLLGHLFDRLEDLEGQMAAMSRINLTLTEELNNRA